MKKNRLKLTLLKLVFPFIASISLATWYEPVDPAGNIPLASGPEPRWIHCRGLARKKFNLPHAPGKVHVYALAKGYGWPSGCGIKIYFNGKPVKHQPYSDIGMNDAGQDLSYHIMKICFADAAKFAKKGSNTIAIAVLREDVDIEENAAPADMNGKIKPCRLIARVEIEKSGGSMERIAVSDNSWKTSGNFTKGWQKPSFNDAAWKYSRQETVEPCGEQYFAVLPGIKPEKIFRQNPRDGEIRNAGNILEIDDSWATLVPGKDSQPFIDLDFGRTLTGDIEAVIECGSAATVSIASDETAFINPGFSDEKEFTARKGTIRTRWLRTARFARIALKSASAPVKIDGVSFNYYNYPVEYRGSFRSSDKLLDRIWDCGAFSARMCMQKVYVDGARIERRGWIADAYPQILANYAAFGDTRLAEISLKEFSGSGDNFLQYCMANNTLIWIILVSEHYRYTGDSGIIRRYRENMIKTVDYVMKDLDANLLWSLGGPLDEGESGKTLTGRNVWAWIDWHGGTIDQKGEKSRLAGTQMYLIWALRELAFMLEETGDSGSAAKYRNSAGKLAAAANRFFWRDDAGAYADSSDHGRKSASTSRQINALAILSGTAGSAKTESIVNCLFRGTDYSGSQSGYFNRYMIEALSMAGYREKALSWVRQYWGGMVRGNATTYWETYDITKNDNAETSVSCRSKSHGWSAGVTHWLSSYILGIKPLKPGFSEFIVEPYLSNLTSLSGTYPTPRGVIRVDYRIEGKSVRTKLRVPAKTTGWFVTGYEPGTKKPVMKKCPGPGDFVF